MIDNKFNIWLQNRINKYETDMGEEYIGFYNDDYDEILSEMLAIFHKNLNKLFEYMNYRLGNRHYTADASRELIGLIEDIDKFRGVAKKFNIAVGIDDYYQDVINKCNEFLSSSGGSTIPKDFKRISIIDYDSIFKVKTDEYIEITDKNKNIKLSI